MKYAVVFSLESLASRRRLEVYLAERFSTRSAKIFGQELMTFCKELETFPKRGSLRPELGREVRVIGFKDRVGVIFDVDDAAATVTIADFLYAGRTVQ